MAVKFALCLYCVPPISAAIAITPGIKKNILIATSPIEKLAAIAQPSVEAMIVIAHAAAQTKKHSRNALNAFNARLSALLSMATSSFIYLL